MDWTVIGGGKEKMKRTLYDKIWEDHIIESQGDLDLIYVDMHYIHEVTSPQAFEGLRLRKRKLRQPEKTFATMDHNTPTVVEERKNINDPLAKAQIEALEENCKEYNIRLASMESPENGIVHIIGPELGLTKPGQVIVCGDSHTTTHGAFGTIAFGIGTSQVEHVFATQGLWQKKLKNMGVKVIGKLPKGVYPKDVILKFIKDYGVSVGTGYAIEFYGETVENMNMEERMTLSNMSVEAGAKVGIIRPDRVTWEYLKNKKYTAGLQEFKDFEKTLKDKWESLYTDGEEAFDKIIYMDISSLKPQVSWGTNPSMTVSVNEKFPVVKNPGDEKAYEYMGLKSNQRPEDIQVSEVFIGSCTNGRYSDLLEAGRYIENKKVVPGIRAVIVPGSVAVKRQAEESGLAEKFKKAGFIWREPGCSSCLGMNPDIISSGAHCVSTSNRNFEGRQGKGARTHLVSPAMAARCAVEGKIVDITEVNLKE